MQVWTVRVAVVVGVAACSTQSSADETRDPVRDIRSVEADLQIPRLSARRKPNSEPPPGLRFKECIPEYANTLIHHVTYLPTDWRPGVHFPVIFEFAGNGNYTSPHGDVSTGQVENSKLGYGITAGKEAIWVCLPYLNASGTENVATWWGDAPEYDPSATIDYCVKAVDWICNEYGGDRRRVVLAGFSRGAIACNYIGLHNDRIASLWRGFVVFSHYDGVRSWSFPESDRKSAARRLGRLGDRPQFICSESDAALRKTKDYLESIGKQGDFTFTTTGFRNHNDAWILRPSQTRTVLREWFARVVAEQD